MEAQKNSFRHDTLAGKINSLLSYANARYRDLYEKADDQQLRGKVSKSKRGSESFDLNVPDEKKSICKLAIYTFTYATRDDKAYLKDRGEHYWKNRSVQNICDNGWDVKEELLLTEARLMVDYCAYRQLHSHSSYWIEGRKSRKFDHWPATLSHDQSLDSDTFALFPKTLHAFLLKEKKWITVRISQVSEISWNKQAFHRLVLPQKPKDLIESLVLVRISEIVQSKCLSIARKRKDMIAGKGNGLIMLLHVAPRTGKILTTERLVHYLVSVLELSNFDMVFKSTSVAELAEKPLYNVTCGDIGTNAEEVERYLKSVLFLGKMWNCILLLDEANMFLKERSLSDLKRNSLVSGILGQ